MAGLAADVLLVTWGKLSTVLQLVNYYGEKSAYAGSKTVLHSTIGRFFFSVFGKSGPSG